MKFSYSWLTEHLKTNVHFEEIEKKLTSMALKLKIFKTQEKHTKILLLDRYLKKKNTQMRIN